MIVEIYSSRRSLCRVSLSIVYSMTVPLLSIARAITALDVLQCASEISIARHLYTRIGNRELSLFT